MFNFTFKNLDNQASWYHNISIGIGIVLHGVDNGIVCHVAQHAVVFFILPQYYSLCHDISHHAMAFSSCHGIVHHATALTTAFCIMLQYFSLCCSCFFMSWWLLCSQSKKEDKYVHRSSEVMLAIATSCTGGVVSCMDGFRFCHGAYKET